MVKKDIINLINKYVEYNGKLKITDRKFLDYVNIDESEIIINIDKYQYLEEYNLTYSYYGVKKYINIKDKYLLKILNYCYKNIKKDKPMNKETNFDSKDIDKFKALDNLAYIGIDKSFDKDKINAGFMDFFEKATKIKNTQDREEIIKKINNIIEEYGSFSSYDIDKYLSVDGLKCGRVDVLAINYEVDKVYCEIVLCDSNLDNEYYDYNILDIEVLKEILEYCNIYKQQCIEN